MKSLMYKQTKLPIFLLFTLTISLNGQELTKETNQQISISNSEKPVRIMDVIQNELVLTKITNYSNFSDYDFIYNYYKTIESSLNRNRKTGKLGKKTIKGLKTGEFQYKCKLSGWNEATITMKYVNYCDLDFTINGITTVIVDWKGSGTMSGQVQTVNPVKGLIEYNLIVTKGTESGGHYILERPENGYKTKIPSDLVLSFADRDIVLDERCNN